MELYRIITKLHAGVLYLVITVSQDEEEGCSMFRHSVAYATKTNSAELHLAVSLVGE